MIAAAFLAAGLTTAAIAETPMLPDAAAYAEEATEWVLDGQTLPRGYRVRLMQMSPEARLQTLIFLRRVGLLMADAWTLADILAPATAPRESSE